MIGMCIRIGSLDISEVRMYLNNSNKKIKFRLINRLTDTEKLMHMSPLGFVHLG